MKKLWNLVLLFNSFGGAGQCYPNSPPFVLTLTHSRHPDDYGVQFPCPMGTAQESWLPGPPRDMEPRSPSIGHHWHASLSAHTCPLVHLFFLGTLPNPSSSPLVWRPTTGQVIPRQKIWPQFLCSHSWLETISSIYLSDLVLCSYVWLLNINVFGYRVLPQTPLGLLHNIHSICIRLPSSSLIK